jgi:hypothetical protein
VTGLPRVALRAALAALALASATGCTHAAPEPVAPTPPPGPVDPGHGLTVAPQSALFHVTLRPGETHVAEAALTNTSAEPRAVAMSTVVDRLSTTDQVAPDLELSGRLGACSGEGPDAALTAQLGSGTALPLGTVGPGRTVPLCGRISLPTDTALPDGASVTFTLVLASVEHPGDAAGSPVPGPTRWPDRAVLTRHPLPVAAAAAGATGVAAALLVLRRRTRTTTPPGHDPRPEDLT